MFSRLHHVGIGVSNIEKSLSFYRDLLGLRVIHDFRCPDPLLEKSAGPTESRVVYLGTKKGETYVKLVQILRSPFPLSAYAIPANRRWGDIEYCEFCLRVLNVQATYAEAVKKGARSAMEFTEFVVSGKDEGDVVSAYAYVRDPDDALVEFSQAWQEKQKVGIEPGFTGIITLAHVGLGVTDMEKAIVFYKDHLGLDSLIYDISGGPSAMSKLVGEPLNRRIVMLGSKDGMSTIELIQAFPPYRPRHRSGEEKWGGIGTMEMGVEVKELEKVIRSLSQKGVHIIGKGGFREEMKAEYAYVRNPDGLEVELVEYVH